MADQQVLFVEERPCASCGATPSTFQEECPWQPVLPPWEQPPERGERPRDCIIFDPDRSPIPF